LGFVKIRSFSPSGEELWLHEWKNPLSRQVAIGNPTEFLQSLQRGLGPNGWVLHRLFATTPEADPLPLRCYLDKIPTGFITWSKTIKGYRAVLDGEKPFRWDEGSLATLEVIQRSITSTDYLQQLSVLWSQESNKGGSLDVRSENTNFIKYLGGFHLRML